VTPQAATIEAGASVSARELALNIILFQVVWFACILGAAHGYAWLGIAATAAVVAFHAARAAHPAAELKLIGLAVAMGVVLDSVPPALGLVEYPGNAIAPFAPAWILALWANFAMTLNVSLSWLKRRLLLAAVLGAIAGPLSYYGGVKLGALLFSRPEWALAAIALEWAVAMPLLALLARRYDGITTPRTPACTGLSSRRRAADSQQPPRGRWGRGS
jgi:hypothetical protein